MTCHLQCSTTAGKVFKGFPRRSHWHCCLCSQLFERSNDFQAHLRRHERSSKTPKINSSKVAKVPLGNKEPERLPPSVSGDAHGLKEVCPDCLQVYANKRSLQRHIREVHKKKREGAVTASKHLPGVCVDLRKGIFMVRRTFSGILRPVHCQHSTHGTPSTAVVSACELDECREAARVAKQSGHPAFECVHLQSIQYALSFSPPVTLTERSLEDLVGQKLRWFKETRKQACLALKKRADDGKHPLIVGFPSDEYHTSSRRFRYFSVYNGDIHYWSRFGRVIVGFDTLHTRWMCACCRSKVNCIHKCVAKWYIYQCEPSLLSETRLEEGENDGPISEGDSGDDDLDENPSPPSSSVYPPSGTVLEEMVRYQHANKRMPPVLPHDILNNQPIQKLLIPSEQICHICQSALDDPREITKRAMIIGLTKVVSGTDVYVIPYLIE